MRRTVTAHAVMPACACPALAWPGAAAEPVSPGSGNGWLSPGRRPGIRLAVPVEWPPDPGRDALCTLTSPLRLVPWR
jgi:hypothetical protein